jgi:hypothetical protein
MRRLSMISYCTTTLIYIQLSAFKIVHSATTRVVNVVLFVSKLKDWNDLSNVPRWPASRKPIRLILNIKTPVCEPIIVYLVDDD